jgi:hypothetical protein
MSENDEGFFYEFEEHVFIFNTVLWLANADTYLFLRKIYGQKLEIYNKTWFFPEKNHPYSRPWALTYNTRDSTNE